jgi:hypothetical protein
LKEVPLDRSKSPGKLSSEEHDIQLAPKFVPLENSNAGKDVSLSQLLHAPLKLMSSLAVSLNVTAGKDVKLASLQPCHALVKLVPRDRFKAGKDSSWVQSFHASVKLISSSAWVLNVQAPNEVIAVLPFHDSINVTPLDRFKAGNVVRAVQPLHAVLKEISSVAVVLKVQAPKEVIAVQSFHVELTSVPLDRLRAGKEVSLVQLRQVLVKSISSSASVLKVTAGKDVKPTLLHKRHAA